MALEAFDRNLERYEGKLSRFQIASLTADQGNAAFGGMNAMKLGRSATTQDILRLALIAPDFLEQRARFVGQALKPWGAEQRRALIGGGIAAYTICRALNNMITGDPHWDKPFSVIGKNGTEYRARLVQADIVQALTHAGEFMDARLSPGAKLTVTSLTGRDNFGRKRTAQALWDTVMQGVPMAIQKRLRNPQDYSLLDSMMQAAGISSGKYYSAGAKAARDYLSEQPGGGNPASLEKSTQTRELQQERAAGKISSEQLAEKVRNSEITEQQARKIESPAQDSLVTDFAPLPIEEALDLWPQYSADEQQKLSGALRKKASAIDRLDRTALQKLDLKQRARQALGGR